MSQTVARVTELMPVFHPTRIDMLVVLLNDAIMAEGSSSGCATMGLALYDQFDRLHGFARVEFEQHYYETRPADRVDPGEGYEEWSIVVEDLIMLHPTDEAHGSYSNLASQVAAPTSRDGWPMVDRVGVESAYGLRDADRAWW